MFFTPNSLLMPVSIKERNWRDGGGSGGGEAEEEERRKQRRKGERKQEVIYFKFHIRVP